MNPKIITILKISWIVLLVGTLLEPPYFYYQILRFYICGLFWYQAYTEYIRNPESKYVWVYWFIAALFNPILPFYFWRELWLIIDLIIIPVIVFSLLKGWKK